MSIEETRETLLSRVRRLALFLADCEPDGVAERLRPLRDAGVALKAALVADSTSGRGSVVSPEETRKKVSSWEASLSRVPLAPIHETRWYRAAKKKEVPGKPPSWTFADTLSVMSSLAWALPEGGALAATGVAGVERIMALASAQEKYLYEKSKIDPKSRTELERVVDVLLADASRSEVNRRLDKVMRAAILLDKTVRKNEASARSGEAMAGTDKTSCEEALKGVETFVKDELSRLSISTGYTRRPEVGLVTPPTMVEYAFHAWLSAATVAVAAYNQYITVLLQPPEAWNDGSNWLDRTVVTRDAVREDEVVSRVVSRFVGHLNELIEHLAIAERMRASILGRLAVVSTRKLPTRPQFLNEDMEIEVEVGAFDMDSATSRGQELLRAKAAEAPEQWILEDMSLKEETWAEPYWNFRKTLTVKWKTAKPHVSPFWITEWALNAIKSHVSNEATTFVSAVGERVPIVEWAAHERMIDADAIRWCVAVSDRYLDAYNYAIDFEESIVTLKDMVDTERHNWTALREFYSSIVKGITVQSGEDDDDTSEAS